VFDVLQEMGPAAGLPPAHGTRSSACSIVLRTAEKRAAAMAEERAEEFHQLELTRLKREADLEEA
jgi:hypothetical protein